jgi:aspartyl-tRNA(Asn)/glutamyl-tRNA(Gln) amidotransferase subunit A
MPELTELTAAQLVDGYRKGEFGPEDATRAALERAGRVQPAVNAFVVLLADEAPAQARESADRRRRGEPVGLLDGVPVTVKDILPLRGHPTLRGSRTTSAGGAVGRRTRRPWPGRASTARCSWAGRRRPSSAGRASRTHRCRG